MTRRLVALAVTAAAVASFAPQASATNVVPCIVEHNRLGFPYGGTDVDPVGTALCIAG